MSTHVGEVYSNKSDQKEEVSQGAMGLVDLISKNKDLFSNSKETSNDDPRGMYNMKNEKVGNSKITLESKDPEFLKNYTAFDDVLKTFNSDDQKVIIEKISQMEKVLSTPSGDKIDLYNGSMTEKVKEIIEYAKKMERTLKMPSGKEQKIDYPMDERLKTIFEEMLNKSSLNHKETSNDDPRGMYNMEGQKVGDK